MGNLDSLTNQELALILLRRLATVETERVAMANLLDFAKDPVSGSPLNWRPMVQASRTETLRDTVFGKYAEIEQLMLGSTRECPNALSLLVKASEGLLQETK